MLRAMSPEDEALYGRICEMQARRAFMVDITAALGVTEEEVRRICAAYRERRRTSRRRRNASRYGQTAERVRLEEAESAYVDLHQAVRVIVRLMPDAAVLAARMTDGWIRGGRRLLYDGDNDKNDAQMVGTYGPDWRTVRPRVLETMSAPSVSSKRCFPLGASAASASRLRRGRKASGR